MEHFTNALDIVLQRHSEGKEKIGVLKEFILRFSQDDIFDNIFELVKFYYLHIPVHFKSEEMLVELLKKHIDKGSAEDKFISEILNEHNVMLDEFNKLKELADKIKAKKGNVKEELVELVNDLCDELVAHSEKEDSVLYPLAKAKLTKYDLVELEKNIARIVI